MNKKLVVIVILVILIIGIAVGAYFILNKNGKCNVRYSKYYMHGESIGGGKEISIAEANIKTVGEVSYYIIYDKPFTKIISSQKDTSGKNIAKSYEGPISNFNASNFSTYTDQTGKYLLGERTSYCGDICKDEIQYQSSVHKKCIYKRVDASIDYGYEDTTRPLKRGFYDIIGQGIANDYCRYTGDQNIKFRCHLSDGTSTNSETYDGKNVTDIITGKQPVDAPPSFIVVSASTKPWYPYGANSFLKSMINYTGLGSVKKFALKNGYTAFAFNEVPINTTTPNTNDNNVLFFKEAGIKTGTAATDNGKTFWTDGAAVAGFKVYSTPTSKLNTTLIQP
jgi:hypothetical protein